MCIFTFNISDFIHAPKYVHLYINIFFFCCGTICITLQMEVETLSVYPCTKDVSGNVHPKFFVQLQMGLVNLVNMCMWPNHVLLPLDEIF